MSHYAIVESWQYILAGLRKELNILKKAEPTEENLKQVNSIEKRAKELTLAIKQYKAAHGMAA